MSISRRTLLALAAQGVAWNSLAREAKEEDYDVNHDESRVQPYVLPELLVTTSGKTVTTAEQWLDVRRPELLALFGNLLYGVVPAAETPVRRTMEVVNVDRAFWSGRATRKEVVVHFENERGRDELVVMVISPNGQSGKLPAFFLHSFQNTRGDAYTESPERPNWTRSGVPVGVMLERGFGFVAVH